MAADVVAADALTGLLVGGPLASIVSEYLELAGVSRLLTTSRIFKTCLAADPVVWHEARITTAC